MRLMGWAGAPHYAWVVLASVMVLLCLSTGMVFSFGVLIDPLVAAHGWSRTAVSFAFSLQFTAGIPVVLVAGRLAERIGTRRIAIAVAAIFMIGLLATATVNRVWQFQFYYGVLIGGLGSSTFVTLLPVLLTRWFHRRLGLATGLMWASSSAGTALIAPLLRWAVGAFGWSQTFIVLGLTGGSLAVVSSCLLRDHPRERKLAPYGARGPDSDLTAAAVTVDAVGLDRVVRMSSFWALVAVHTFGCVGHAIPLAHIVSMATFAGVPAIGAAGVLSIASAVSLVSRFGMSLLADARGGRFTLTLTLLLQTLPMLILLNARDLPSFYAFALVFGLGYGGEMVGFPIYNRQYYGTDAPLTAIYSYQMAGAMLGMAVGGWMGGALFDLTGVYSWSVAAAMGAGALGVAAALILPSPLTYRGGTEPALPRV